jgi:two-component system response regulator VicR
MARALHNEDDANDLVNGARAVNAQLAAMRGTAVSEHVPVREATNSRGTILLIEDDAAIAKMLRGRLGARGYMVWHAATGAEAAAIGEEILPDLVIVDLVLPDANGLVLCADLRQRWTAPIIICTGSKRPEDAVLGLKLGADDFVRKPFSTDELEARIEAALRRPALDGRPSANGRDPATQAPRLEEVTQVIGPLEIDQARCRVLVGGETIHLTPTEYRLLCVLADHPNRVVPSSEVARLVWGIHDVGIERSLQVHMRRMRAKLNAGPISPPAIVAVRGFGYQLVWEIDGTAAERDD